MLEIKDLESTDREIVLFINSHSKSKTSDILNNLSKRISQATLSRHIQELMSEGFITRSGKGKNTSYSGNDLIQHLSVDYRHRKKSNYNFNYLMDFDPSQNQYFSNTELELLAQAGKLDDVDQGELNTKVKSLYEQTAIDLSCASSMLEGNTYDYLDTEVLLKFGQKSDSKDAQEAIMILNHRDAIAYQFDNLELIDINERTIKDVHTLLSSDLKTVQDEEQGDYRKRPVFLGGCTYDPLQVPSQLNEEMTLFCDKAALIKNPFEKSLFTMIMISYMQPFIDVNKRTGRLMSNVPLMKDGLCPLSFRDMDKAKYIGGLICFYELNRHEMVKDAYFNSYISSAPDLKKHVARAMNDVSPLNLEFRKELNHIVKTVVNSHGKISCESALDSLLQSEKRDIDHEVKDNVIMIANKKLNVLGINQLVVYGINKNDYAKYRIDYPNKT